jgi:elongation factor 1-alpha
MELPHINLVIVGHLDQGKSTLIGRLLYDSGTILPDKLKEVESISKQLKKKFEFAFFLDSLKEEREEGLTIDIVQTPFKSKKYSYTIIDCPGHKEFIKNMFSGASQADVAIIIVSAKKDEGVQEQTKRHAFLLKFLGISQIFVVVTKMDLINYDERRFIEIRKDMKEFLNTIGFDTNKIPFIPISAMEGDNVYKKAEKMPWHKGLPLIEILDSTIRESTNPIDKPLRIPIQDIYSIDGKSILVGKIETGVLKVGEKVLFQPSTLTATVDSIEVFNEKKNIAMPQESIGFSLKEEMKIKRGEVCSNLNNSPKASRNFIAELFLLSDMPISLKDEIAVRIGTAEEECKIKKIIQVIDTSTGEVKDLAEVIKPIEAGTVEISSSNSLPMEKFTEIPQLGRLIAIKEGKIVAAGIVKNIN